MNKIILIIFFIIILVFGYYAVIFEPNNIKIEKQVITIKNLPQVVDGVKIIQLSDFHSYWFGPREKRILEIVEGLEPDFVFLTGDFIDPITETITDRDLSSVKIFWQELGKRHQGQIFAVLGNHDNKKVGEYLEKKGIPVLDNENKKIFFGPDYFYLIGVDDPASGRSDLTKAMKGIKSDAPKILLVHGPEIMADFPERKGIDLILAGHTHAGQINIPFLNWLIWPLLPLSDYGRLYLSGLFKIENTYLYVNRGIGTSMIPVRINCPPEITLIYLRSDLEDKEQSERKLKIDKIDFQKFIVADNFLSARSVHAVDIDRDGRIDVLGAARKIHQIAWWQNQGNNNFIKSVIDNDFRGAFSVHSVDLDNDNYKDVIGASLYDG